ncbi:unnamed protein product [Ambrosiozyma monospora]|uniref:Unnamed protein product n=1 Tax=Ambrosiozyma monospora TaxID=43982 RepID=A0ACB5TER0_AMBMO|nr:unnamed protein product [Ambrosiozyma monospora]
MVKLVDYHTKQLHLHCEILNPPEELSMHGYLTQLNDFVKNQIDKHLNVRADILVGRSRSFALWNLDSKTGKYGLSLSNSIAFTSNTPEIDKIEQWYSVKGITALVLNRVPNQYEFAFDRFSSLAKLLISDTIFSMRVFNIYLSNLLEPLKELKIDNHNYSSESKFSPANRDTDIIKYRHGINITLPLHLHSLHLFGWDKF